MKLGNWPSGVAHILSFYPKGSKLSLFSLYGQRFPIFHVTVGLRAIFNIAIFGHETLWPKCQNLHIYSLSTPVGLNWAYFRSMGSGVRDKGWFSKLLYLGMKLGHWPKLHIYSLSTPGGQNWAYFRSTGSGFWHMDRFSNLPYLGMKLGH